MPVGIEPTEFLSVTVIIPTYNCSQIISLTLDSVIKQKYPGCEILVIDGGSTDRTMEVLHSYHSRIRLCSAGKYDIFPMINQGIALAKGDYINILFPGDFYIYSQTLREMMKLAQEHGQPELAYCATLLRNGRAEVKFLFRSLTLSLLKKGQQPTSLQACWFKKEVFEEIGSFSTAFKMRSAFDFFCRFSLHPTFRFATLQRGYVDFDLRAVTSSMVFRHIWETGQIINAHFGKWPFLNWLLHQREVKRFACLWAKQLRVAFQERK